jgi:hypothetical protein
VSNSDSDLFNQFNTVITSIEEDLDLVRLSTDPTEKRRLAKQALMKLFSLRPPKYSIEFMKTVKPIVLECIGNISKSIE